MVCTNGNGMALAPVRTNRLTAVFARQAAKADHEVRAHQQAESDQAEAEAIAVVMSDAERAHAKYVTFRGEAEKVIQEIASGELTDAEVAIKETLLATYQRRMAAALSEFCGSTADGDRIAATDIGKLRKQHLDRRGLHARTQPRDDSGRFDRGEACRP